MCSSEQYTEFSSNSQLVTQGAFLNNVLYFQKFWNLVSSTDFLFSLVSDQCMQSAVSYLMFPAKHNNMIIANINSHSCLVSQLKNIQIYACGTLSLNM